MEVAYDWKRERTGGETTAAVMEEVIYGHDEGDEQDDNSERMFHIFLMRL